MNPIYLDNAATTALRPEVVDAMMAILKDTYGNASSTHSIGRTAKAVLEQCRKSIASQFNAQASEIVFTSGGTEADNLAMRSAVRDLGVSTIITSAIEHHAVLHTAEQLAAEYGIELCLVDLDVHGQPQLPHLEHLLSSRSKVLVSLMHINNEIGNIADLKAIGNLCKRYQAFFHSDMVQSVGHFKLDMTELPVDFFAASAHKFHGPKGVGFCYIRRNSGLKPLIFGGEQERGIRAGTEAIHNIAGMNRALELAYLQLDAESSYIKELKAFFIASLKKEIPEIEFNGLSSQMDQSTYTLVNVRLPLAADKSSLLQFQLDLKGIACSKGSACQSGSVGQSHVLEAILDEEDLQKPSVRFSFSIYNTKEELEEVVQILKEFIYT
jgi:cysteine desulfurase